MVPGPALALLGASTVRTPGRPRPGSPKNTPNSGSEYTKLPLQEAGPSTPNCLRRKASLCQRWHEGEFTVNPEKNAAMDAWDLILMFALLTTSVVVPYEVAMMADPSMGWLAINRCVDIVFILDMILSFNLAYPVSSTLTNNTYEKAPLKIAQHYMAVPFSDNFEAGWFWPDIVTVFPWELFPQFFGSGASERSVRLVRVLRLFRLFRLVRVVKLFQRWHAHLGLSYSLLSLVKCLGFVILSLHWLACLWGFVARPPWSSGDGETWLSRRAHMDDRMAEDYRPEEIYNLALYFSTMTLTSVGFGDIRPVNDCEVVLVTMMMITTGFMWAFVLASTVNIVTNMDTYTSRFQDRMDELNLLMASRNVNPALRWRLRRYMHESFHVQRQRHQRETIGWLSGGLQGELAMESGVDKVCNLIWYLNGQPEAVIVEVASYFVSEMYSPNEFIQDHTKVFVIRKGSCMRKARILTRDQVVGDDMILTSALLRDTAVPRTLTFLEVLALSRKDLFKVAESHPDFGQRLRMAQIKLAIWRGTIYAARQIKVKGSRWDKLWEAFQGQQESGTAKIKPQCSSVAVATSEFDANSGLSTEALVGGGGAASTDALVDLRRIRALSELSLERLDQLHDRMGTLEERMAALEAQRQQEHTGCVIAKLEGEHTML